MAAKKAAAARTRRRTMRAAEKAPGVYFLSLTLENVRCFGPPQTLDLSDGQGRPRRWTVILGNNGVGKTTLLQALVATWPVKHPELAGRRIPWLLTYATPDVFALHEERLQRSPELAAHLSGELASGGGIADLVSRFEKAKITIRLEGTSQEWELAPAPDQVNPPCFAYGATRRMGSGSLSEPDADPPVATLFRDDAPLRNAEEWLLQADYAASKPSRHRAQARERRDAIKAVLIDLLPDVEDIEILADVGDNPARPRPGIRLKTPYGWVPLQALSLGYKTLLAWMVDLASRLYERYPESENPLAEPAVVLVDEIDLHLHPRWQRELLGYLSKHFPNVQFIVTAHSPLVVQAAAANLVVLRREGDHVTIDKGPSAVRSWRVDQILTSDLFELPSARPPALDGLLAERREILTKPRLSAADRRALERIERELADLPGGETPEQMEAMAIIQRAARSLKKTGGGAASSG